MDLNDRKAWDDSDLINTWDEALEEYKVRIGIPIHENM